MVTFVANDGSACSRVQRGSAAPAFQFPISSLHAPNNKRECKQHGVTAWSVRACCEINKGKNVVMLRVMLIISFQLVVAEYIVGCPESLPSRQRASSPTKTEQFCMLSSRLRALSHTFFRVDECYRVSHLGLLCSSNEYARKLPHGGVSLTIYRVFLLNRAMAFQKHLNFSEDVYR